MYKRLSDPKRALSPGFIVLAAGLTLLFAGVLFTMAATQWREFRIPDDWGSDLAFFNQGFYLALHGDGWLHSTVVDKYHGSILGGHFSPGYYLFLPFYAMWQSPLLLLLVASFAVAAAGLGVLLAARWIFGSGVIALVWFGLFVLHPPIAWSVLEGGFREVFVGTGFLSFALLCYMSGNYRLFFLTVTLALLSKEDIALLLPVWGVVAWLQGKGWRLAGSMALLGVTYFLVANVIALPLIRGHHFGHIYFENFLNPLGQTPKDMLHAIPSAPGVIPHAVLSRQNLLYWAAIFSPVLFLPALGWEYAVIPAYIYLEISLDRGFQQIPLYHVFPALPFIFAAAMEGTSRLTKFIARMSRLTPARAAAVRTASLVVLLCGMMGSALHSMTFPDLVRVNWPAEAALRRDAPLFHALAQIPPSASLGATASLIAQSPSRDVLNFIIRDGTNFWWVDERAWDYIGISLEDINDSPRARRWIASLLCQGTYGVVYQDHLRSARILLARGASLSANRRVFETVLPGPRRDCPVPGQEAMDRGTFARAASIHARVVPSEVWSWEMFPEPIISQQNLRFSQLVHLPDHTFEPGWYRLELAGVRPLVSASYRITMQVFVGDRPVGRVTTSGDQPLRYTTPPFRIDRRQTLPVEVRADLWVTGGRIDQAWAFRPARKGCAIVADAPSLTPQQVTVEAWIYLDGMPRSPATLAEAPILSKHDADGYYLRLSGDEQKKMWVDFNVAGKWAVGLAGVGMVPIHRWTAIAATYDGEEARIFIDGREAPQEVSRSPHHVGAIRGQGGPLVIGCRAPGRSDEVVFPGLVGAASVWNRVLAPREIEESAAMWAVPSGNTGGLVGSWGFQSIDAGIIPDLSGAGNPITNAVRLTRVRAPAVKRSFTWWRTREMNLLRMVTLRSVRPM